MYKKDVLACTKSKKLGRRGICVLMCIVLQTFEICIIASYFLTLLGGVTHTKITIIRVYYARWI